MQDESKMTEQVPAQANKARTCSHCGLSPIPDADVVYRSGAIMCLECANRAPKRIDMWNSLGQVWWNSSGGGERVQYVRADLAEDAFRLLRAVRGRMLADGPDAGLVQDIDRVLKKAG